DQAMIKWQRLIPRCRAHYKAYVLGTKFLMLLFLLRVSNASAIDRYEIQIYSTETAPLHRLTLELHSNTVLNAVGPWPRKNFVPTKSTRLSKRPMVCGRMWKSANTCAPQNLSTVRMAMPAAALRSISASVTLKLRSLLSVEISNSTI